MMMLLSGFLVASVFQLTLMMSLHTPGASLLGLVARFGLAGGLVYAAIHLAEMLSLAREEARQEFNKKLETEFADRRKIEQELAHLASFAEMDLGAIIELGARYELRYVNPSAEQAFVDLKEKGKAHPIFEGLEAAAALLRSEHKLTAIRTVSHGDRLYRQQICLLETSPGVRIHMADVTEWTQLERIQTGLFKRLPAELQSPLAGIQQALQRSAVALRSQMNREQEDEFLTALRQLGDANRFTQELIENSQLTTSRVEIRRQRADLAAVVREAAAFLGPVAQTRGIELSVQNSPPTLEMLFDRERLLPTLTHILQKTLETAAAGRVEISLAAAGKQAQCLMSVFSPGADAPERLRQEAQLAASRAVIEAHGGHMRFQKIPGGFQRIVTLPILNAEDFFCERVRNFHEAVVSHQGTLSLMRLHVPAWAMLRQTLGEEAAGALWTQLLQIVSRALRDDSDVAMQSRQSIWLALPRATRADSQGIAERLRQNLRDYLAQQAIAAPPIELEIKIANYPEDGRAVESLLLLIGWFAQNAPAQAAPPQPAAFPSARRAA